MSTTQTYAVSGMTCGHCESAIRAELSQVSGIEEVDVSASTGRLVVTAVRPVDDAAIIEAIDEAGYRAERV